MTIDSFQTASEGSTGAYSSDSNAALTYMSNVEIVPQLISEIAADAIVIESCGDDLRRALIAKLRKLTLALETPRETMLRECHATTGTIACLSFGVDCGLWDAMARNGDREQSVDELARATHADPVLVARILRHLGAMGYVEETKQNHYKPTGFSRALSNPSISGGILGLLCPSGGAALKFHEFSRKRGFQNPIDAKDTSLMYAYKTKQDVFSWLQSQGYDNHFNNHMRGSHPQPWMASGRFPVQERLIEGADKNPEAPFLVDIGGCVGQDLTDLRRFYPQIPGQLVLQDLPHVISRVDGNQGFVSMEHDFLTEQPIKEARAYYLHYILHDWPDDVCEKIIAQTKTAMKPNYSKLLIHERVLPPTNASWESTALDMVMLTLLSSAERSEMDWRNLLEVKAGLKITRIWKLDLPDECIIECELQ